jgi:hypothetical protein
MVVAPEEKEEDPQWIRRPSLLKIDMPQDWGKP